MATPRLRERIDREVNGRTVLAGLLQAVEAAPDDVALRWRGDGTWPVLTWRQYATAVAAVAGGLRQLGVGRGDRVALLLGNRPEFHVADLAAVAAGAIPVSLHTTSPPAQLADHLSRIGAAAAVVDSDLVERLRAGGVTPARLVIRGGDTLLPGAVAFDELAATTPLDLPAAAASLNAAEPATIVYTSGTGGQPKGVPISHRNVCWTVASLLRRFGRPPGGWQAVSYLPMAHIAERIATHYLPVDQRLVVTTCPNPTQLLDHLRDVRPQLFLGVPRVWETARKAIESLARTDPAGQRALEDAVDLGRRVVRARAAGEEPERALLTAWGQADADTLSVVRGLIGLDRCEVAISSAAPLGAELAEYFLALGVPLSELYGLSESCGPISWRPGHVHPGASGAPIPGCDVRLAHDGEILARAATSSPVTSRTRETADVLDEDGFLHTGDIGRLDGDGCLVITGRKRELLVTPGGTNVAPDPLETSLRRSPLVEHACVLGDRRPYLVALITLDADAARQWSRQASRTALTRRQLAADPAVGAEIDRLITELNRGLRPEERIRRHAVLPDRWHPDSAELTPTDKLRRTAIADRYGAELDVLYGPAT